MFWIFVRTEAILTNIQNICFFKVFITIYFWHNLWQIVTIRYSQIVIITNFVIASSVGIKRVVCSISLNFILFV